MEPSLSEIESVEENAAESGPRSASTRRTYETPRIWDDPSSLRGEILNEEQLERLAETLARSHGSVSTRGTARPLRRRFKAARLQVRKAYATLAHGAERKRDPSPAELWLLDNSHVVEGQLREIEEDLPWGYLVQLPRMPVGPMRGYPLVYGLCLEYLRHTDCRLDLGSLERFVVAYQGVRPLTIGELWAVPIMLRLGLILAVGALASSEANAHDRDHAEQWATRVVGKNSGGVQIRETAVDLVAALNDIDDPSDAFLVTFLRRLRERDDAPTEVLDWISRKTERLGLTPEELARRYHVQQAADQVSVGNAVTSMRSINRLDWSAFFVATSHVEAILSRDPVEAYAVMDDASRDRCRHSVEQLARGSRKSEVEVAEKTLEMARKAPPMAPSRQCHVGYYLMDEGRQELEQAIGYRPRLGAWALSTLLRSPAFFYLGGMGVASCALLFIAFTSLIWIGTSVEVLWMFLPALLLAASEICVAVANALVVTLVPPRLLPKLEFKSGISSEHRTLVVVPTLFDNEETLDRLLEDLEVRSLANSDAYLHFALLTDFPDADVAEREGETELLQLARERVRALNVGLTEPRYFLFHRRRVENRVEGRFMGWERKRGKLLELNRLLRGGEDTTFSVVEAPPELLQQIRYVITLDTDTELPLGVARKLVGVMAHPLNRPVLDAARQRVIRGHALVQPRVGTSPMSARQSIFSRLAAGPPGIDPYTTAVSDVYQDLFGEGSFVGKGIYDVDAFDAALRDRVPENQLLSHDLFESIYARAALASDIEVLDEQPASYDVSVGRQHRWTRGDWQLVPWLLPRVPGAHGARRFDFRLFDVWRVFDNLRRSVLAPALVLLLCASWFVRLEVAAAVALIVLGVFVVPVFGRLVFGFARARSQLEWLGGLGGDMKTNSAQALLSLVFLLDQAISSVDAIVRALYRQLVSRRRLLEWTSMRDASRQAGSGRRWLGVVGVSLVLAFAVGVFESQSWPVALPFLVAWGCSPFIAAWVSRVRPIGVREPWGQIEVRLFRRIARRTWRFFEAFVGDTDNHLPPDNFQEDPRGVVAHRTSPTNIGLYLLSVASARDLGFITLTQALERFALTLTTIERLEKREGHVLNWYDTTTLHPLEPRYVSTVDSGNLAGYLWTLREACRDFDERPFVTVASLEAALDALRLGVEALEGVDKSTSQAARALERRLERTIEECGREPSRVSAEIPTLAVQLRGLAEGTARAAESDVATDSAEVSYWFAAAARTLSDAEADVKRLASYASWLDALPPTVEFNEHAERWANIAARVRQLTSPCTLREDGAALALEVRAFAEDCSYARQAMLEGATVLDEAARFGAECGRALEEIADRANALVEAMRFDFLYDEERSLFSIGYNVGGARLDNSHYDLLASEARLASLVAIAKGDIPQKHWFRLGRLRAEYASAPGLLSWSGSMFEYLMPLLVMRSYPDTLLDQTYHATVERQMSYARSLGVPWGISEAAYNVMDLGMNYQYRAFGVPETGLKPGLGEDLVVAPYATALAALVRARGAARNFERLTKNGLEGPYGYYESIDYTPSRLPPGRKAVVVKAFMAHHQGMTLVALSNLLDDFSMQRRFHADTRVKACALLLEERIPMRSGVVQPETPRVPSTLALDEDRDTAERISGKETWSGELRSHLLGTSTLSSFVATNGGGFLTYRGIDVNRFREEGALDPGGTYVYVRNHTADRLWSTSFLPTRVEPEFYDVVFSLDKIEILRRDGDVETLTEIVVSPEQPVEVRRLTLSNHGANPVELDLTTYTELCLGGRSADVAHPAFQKMFVETEFWEERNALLARRRPRSPGEAETWVAQILVPSTDNVRNFDFDTSRAHFLGRGRDMETPVGLDQGAKLARRVGCVLDPAFVLRRSIQLEPGAQAKLSLITLLGESRDAVMELVDSFATQHAVHRAFELAWADARVELKHLGVGGAQIHRYQRLLSSVLFPTKALRGPLDPPAGKRGRDALWSQGISGDLPLVVLRLDDAEFLEPCRDLLLAHEFWRLNGVTTDLLLLNEEAESYLQPVQEAVLGLIRSTPAAGHVDQRGGVFIRRTAHLSAEDLALVLSAARVVLRASAGTLAQQLRGLSPPKFDEHALLREAKTLSGTKRPQVKKSRPTRAKTGRRIGRAVDDAAREGSTERASFVSPLDGLLFADAQLGGFEAEGHEYVIEITPTKCPPLPWCNVIAGPRFGCLVSDSGASFTWLENSQKNRLTPWSNDPTLDPSGELFFVRDSDTGKHWSLTPMPAGKTANYVVRHGQGYSSFEHSRSDLKQRLTISVSPTDPVKVCHVEIENTGSTTRRVGLVGYVEWVLGNHREVLRVSTATDFRPELRAVLARNPFSPFPEQRAFFASTAPLSGFSGDRSEFFGRSGDRAKPHALLEGSLSGRTGSGYDPCAALQVEITLEPGEKKEISFLLGAETDEEKALELLRRYVEPERARVVASESTLAWNEILGSIVVKTPDPAFDLLTNRWLLYQALGCRFWGRSAFFQSGGAFGYRDQLQDSLAFVHARPDLTRAHLLVAAARQFSEGDVQHWWHADTGEGVRTHCSDDLLWLPWVASHYAESTGDASVWEERVPFLHERPLKDGEHDLYSVPAQSQEIASFYEHCGRALERAIVLGPQGLPTIRQGDWNDGMNRVGIGGVGESVWLAWFLADSLRRFAEVARARGDHGRSDRYRAEASRLGERIDAAAWDGGWYRRAFFDDGSPLGSSGNEECRIDAIAQSWSVISGVGDPARAHIALEASVEQLVDRDEKLIKLLTPPFSGRGPDPGYIAAYPPGVRENGGQYTHGVLWTVLASFLSGKGNEGYELLSLLNPIRHGTTQEEIARYQGEPYVVAADVYAAPPHVGRGGWTWYTGSASWMYRIGVEWMLGIRRAGGDLIVDPCIPSTWSGFEASYRTPGGGTLFILVENPDAVSSGVLELELDGKRLNGSVVPLPTDEANHRLRVRLGGARSSEARLRGDRNDVGLNSTGSDGE